MVPPVGLEPTRPMDQLFLLWCRMRDSNSQCVSTPGPKPGAYTNSANPALAAPLLFGSKAWQFGHNISKLVKSLFQ